MTEPEITHPAPSADDQLTDKQRRFLKIKAENPGISDRKAMRQAGYSDYTSDSSKRNLRNSPKVKRTLMDWLKKEGVTDALISKTIREGFNAKRVTTVKKGEKRITGADGNETIVYALEDKELIDYTERRQQAEFVTKLRGDFVERTEQSHRYPDGLPPIELTVEEEKHIESQLGVVFHKKKKRGVK